MGLLPREFFARGGDDRTIVEASLAPDLDPAAARALGIELWNAIPASDKRMIQRGNRITVELTRRARDNARSRRSPHDHPPQAERVHRGDQR